MTIPEMLAANRLAQLVMVVMFLAGVAMLLPAWRGRPLQKYRDVLALVGATSIVVCAAIPHFIERPFFRGPILWFWLLGPGLGGFLAFLVGNSSPNQWIRTALLVVGSCLMVMSMCLLLALGSIL